MSKLLLYTDPHICTNSSVIRTRGDVFSTRLEYLKKTFDWINKIAQDRACEDIICLGDLFDCCNLTAEEITATQSFNLYNHYFIVGNHDSNKNDLSFNAINIYKKDHIITQPTLIKKWGCGVLLLPYTSNVDNQRLEYIDKDLIILSHNDLKGVNYGGYVSEFGYDLQNIQDNCCLFINGHIHNGSWVKKNRIMNLGSVIGLNFSNDCSSCSWKPSIAVLDTLTKQIEFIENPYSFLFYNVKLNTKQDIQRFVNTLQMDMPNVVSMKVPSSLVDFTKQVQKDNQDSFYYFRILVDYSDQKTLVQQTQSATNHFTSLNHYDKLKQFVSEKFEQSSLNYKLMMEEIEGIRQ